MGGRDLNAEKMEAMLEKITNDIQRGLKLRESGDRPALTELLGILVAKRDVMMKELEGCESTVMEMADKKKRMPLSMVDLIMAVGAVEKTFLIIEIVFAKRLNGENTDIQASVLRTMETIGDVEERCKDLGFVLHDMNSTGFEYGAIVAYTKSVQERRRVVEKKKNTLDEVLGIVSNDIEKNMDLPRLLGGGNPGELRLLSKILGKRSDLASKTLEARETDVVMMVEAGVWKSISVVNLLRTVSAAEKTFLFIELAFAERIDDEIRTSVLENMEIIDIERRRRNDLLVVLDSLDKNDVGEGVAAAYAVCVQVRRTDELLKKKETMMRELRQLHAANEATIRGYDIDPKSQHSARRATEALDKDLKILIKTSNDMPKVGDYNNRLEKLVEKLNGMRYKDLTPGEENIVRSASLAPKSAHFKDRLKAWNDEINELNALLARSRFHERFRSSGMPKAGRYESDEDLEGACGDDCCRRCGRLTIR